MQESESSPQKEIIRSSRGTDVKEIKQSVGILLKKIDNLNKAIATEAFGFDAVAGQEFQHRRIGHDRQNEDEKQQRESQKRGEQTCRGPWLSSLRNSSRSCTLTHSEAKVS